MKKLLNIILIAVLTATPALHALYAQDSKQEKQNAKQQALKDMISSRRYTFVAQSATPMNGSVKQLTPDYGLSVKNDTLNVYLPYYGRAYTATIGSTEGGINFKSLDIEYTEKEAKKGGWDISIKPKDQSDAQQLTLSISSSGYTTVRVTSNTREMISFYGYIRQ